MNRDKLDKAFSEFIRLRDADDNGMIRCISCGKLIHWKKADAGHYVNRKHSSLRWSETNVNAQCVPCNRFDEGNLPAYGIVLEKKFGKGIIEKLLAAKKQTVKYSQTEKDLLTKHYQSEVKRIKKEKGL